jgi:thioredoxin 1
MAITEITSEQQFNNYIANTTPTTHLFVDFYATWCGPCQRIAPQLEKLNDDPTNDNITFLKVDITNNLDLKTKYNIKSLPSFLIFNSGSELPCINIIGADFDKIKYAVSLLSNNSEQNDDF